MIKIIKPGLLTTIQDLGRYGFQKFGVIVSGVMDSLSHRIANLLVGNEENAPTLEITMVGPVIEFERDTLISICGGDLSPSIDGKFVPLWRPVLVKKGSQLRFGQCKTGCRSYLAVAGGFDVPRVMGSTSTYLRAGIGGFKGRPLKTGDELKLSPPNNRSVQMIHDFSTKIGDQKFVATKWSVSAGFIPISNKIPSIRVIKGRQYQLFSKESQKSFFREPFEITIIKDHDVSCRQVIRMVKEGKVTSLQGKDVSIQADTICIHGDGEHALDFAKYIRKALKEANITVTKLGDFLKYGSFSF